MTLLTSITAAVICTIIWYRSEQRSEMKLGFLCLMFWSASLMWLVDAFFEYAELGADYFAPEAADMLNDLYLGLSVVALGLIIWLVVLLIRDPKGIVRDTLFRKNQ
ncbi:MAG: hypothetical protein J5518_10445 [Lachnospiraceae bacterium]|nr:hypothetical protein [Lachnospiraceae bacterium]